MKKILLILISLPIIAFTQNSTEEDQEMRNLIFQLLDSKDVRNQLESKGWETREIEGFTGEDNNQYFKYSFQKYNSNWEYFTIDEYASYSYQNSISLITNQDFYKDFYNFITKSKYRQKDKKIEYNITTTILIKQDIEIEFYEELNDTYKITIYNISEKEERKMVFLELQEKIRNEIADFKQEIDVRIINAENSIKFKQYNDALTQYNIISYMLDSIPINITDSIDIYHYQNLLRENISDVEILKKTEIVRKKLKEGLNYFNANKYDFALQIYTNVLNVDPYNKTAQNQIRAIKEIEEILANRKKIHSFKKISPTYYNVITNDLEDGLEKIIRKSKQGNVSISFKIQFDTLGNNLTNYSINSISNVSGKTEKNINDLLNQKKNYLDDKKTMIKKYYISSIEDVNINLEWDTEKSSVKFSHKDKLPYDVSKKLTNYISLSGNNYGRYNIIKKNKKVNNYNYTDISLIDYKMAGGPSNALYSLIIPGLGTKKVTYGKKGSKRMKNFFFWAAVTTTAKLLSNSVYTDYLNATNQEDIDKNYSNATTYNYVYVGALSICTTIYITDFFSALSIGKKNKKKSKALRDQLRNNEINITNNKIKIN